MALNSIPAVEAGASDNNRVYRATQSGTYNVDIKPGVYRVTRQATTNIIIGSTTITPSTIPTMVFINTPQTAITFNSTVSQNTTPWVNRGASSIGVGDAYSLYYDDFFKFYFTHTKSDVNEWALSTDAITWVRFTQTLSENYFTRWNRPVRTSSNLLIGYGEFSQLSGGGPYIWSTNGRGWSKGNVSVTGSGNWNGLYCAATGPSDMVVMGGLTNNNTGWIIWSNTPTNTTWSGSAQMSGEAVITGMYGNGRFVFGGSVGSMRVSTNGSTWTVVNPGFGAQGIQDIIFAQGKYVAVGNTGIIRISTDATTWTSVTSGFPTNVSITDIVYSPTENVFTAFSGPSSLVRISTDAVTWQERTVPVAFSRRCVVYAESRYTFLQENDTNTFTVYTVNDIVPMSSTVPFTDTYVMLDFKGLIRTLV